MHYLTIWDFILYVPYLLIIYAVATAIQNRNIDSNPAYAYYKKGLLVKIAGGFLFCCIYCFYYGGGDTTAYWLSTGIVNKMIDKNFLVYLDIILGNLTSKNFYNFDSITGYPEYWRDPQSFSTIRFCSPLYVLSVESYFTCTLLLSAITYAGVWRLFLMFNREFPGLEKEFAIAILYFPSAIFWGSGIMKDSFTYAATCWFTYSLYMVFIRNEKIFPNIFWIIASGYVLVTCKPYIFVALLPGSLIWVSFKRVQAVKSPVIKVLIAPIILSVFFLGGSLVLGSLDSQLKQYSSVEGVLSQAAVTQQDLKQEHYGENSFDIGQFEGTFGSAITKFPLAVTAGLFRPFIFEARNPVMIISGIENTFLILFTLQFLIVVGLIKMFKYIIKEPLLLFSLTFSLVFAFGIGLSTANFGALVRYKIPLLPFYVSSLYIMRKYFAKT